MMSNDPPITVLYAEDDERLARLTGQYLEAEGVVVWLVTCGDRVLPELVAVRPDVVLLDLMLPGLDGIEVCREIRARADVPIIMVTARTSEADRVLGLEGGADDYVSKPFQSRELLARIRAQARRARGESGPRADRIHIGPLMVDAAAMEATLGGRRLPLTTNELRLLHLLAQRAGRVLTRDQIQHLLFGTAEHNFDRAIDVVVSRLRAKLEQDPRAPRLLKTVRGIGYTLAPDHG
jgi:two-component system OmpR family response regulator